jgi:hypothetical protein
MRDDTVIFKTNGEDSKEELYVQDDGSFALVCTIYNPPPGIPTVSASLMSADDALAYFPEYADRITAAFALIERSARRRMRGSRGIGFLGIARSLLLPLAHSHRPLSSVFGQPGFAALQGPGVTRQSRSALKPSGGRG